MKFKSEYLLKRCLEVEAVLNKAKLWASQDPQLDGYLGGYFAVMISGVFEDCFEHLVYERASRTNDKELTSLVHELVDQTFRNPNAATILGFIKKFSIEYAQEYSSRIEFRHSSALDSIVTDKNSLGHGTLTRNVTISDVTDYFQRSIPILEALEEILS